MNEKTENKIGDLQVWWIPQVPMKAFQVPVDSVAIGAKLLQVLADYDIFQYENKIKPDYSNAGGLQRWCEDNDGNGNPGWEDWYDEETDEDDPEEWLKTQPVVAFTPLSIAKEEVGEECQNCGNIAGPILPTKCPNCGHRDINACPRCDKEVSRQNYVVISGDLFECPQCHGRVRLHINTDLVKFDHTLNQPVVIVEPVDDILPIVTLKIPMPKVKPIRSQVDAKIGGET